MFVEISESSTFRRWFARLRGTRGRARILARIRRLSLGNPGDVKPVGGGVLEMRIPVGPGYRVYFVWCHGEACLLCGGDKASQSRDIVRAMQIAAEWRNDNVR